MATTAENNKRIAKNTLLLYVRMLFTMAVSLYTSRVVLNALGVEDFGIYNVVGGVVAMLGFFNSSLSGASARFITFTIGKGNKQELEQMFSAVLYIHLILAGFVILLGETIGLWFIFHKLVIPIERMTAALWVYHCSILATAVSIISVPYNSLIIAHERMEAFAYISIIEVVLKLMIVYFLVYLPWDHLIVYAILLLIVQILIRLAYSYYCSRHFPESKTIKLIWNSKLIKELSIYAGWTMNGNLAIIGYTQGINILLNLFFGPVVNAARGIAVQVQTAVMVFVQNFQMAIKPQVIKSYAMSDLHYMHTLIIASSKYGFFLMLILASPVILCIDSILNIWLDIVPDYTAAFVRIMLFTGLLAPFRTVLINAIHATGNLKKFQIYEGTSLLTVVPIAYFLLKIYHISPERVILVYFFVELFTQGVRTWIVLPNISMRYTDYLRKVILPVLLPMIFVFVPLNIVHVSNKLSFAQIILFMSGSELYVLLCICFLGLDALERKTIYLFIKKKINHNG